MMSALTKQIIVVLLLFMFSAVPTFGASNKAIKLAVVGVHSGDFAGYGVPTVRAANFVVADYNTKGGIKGNQIEIIVEDDKCDVNIAKAIAINLVNEGVDVVLGHTCPAVTQAVLPIYKDAGVVVVSSSDVSFKSIRSNEYPNYFRTISHGMVQAKIETTFALDGIDAQRIAVLHDGNEYSNGFATLVRDNVMESEKAQVVLFEEVTPSSDGYVDIVKKIEEKNVDVVIFSGEYEDASHIISMMRKNGLKAVFITDDKVDYTSFIESSDTFAEGAYVTKRFTNPENLQRVVATEKHRKMFDEQPGPFYLSGYSAAMAVLNAIDTSETSNLDDIVTAMRTQKVDTPIGKISFDKYGDVVGVAYGLYQVKDAQLVEISH